MIVSKNFVKAYSDLFLFLAEKGGTDEVTTFCELLSDVIKKEMTEKVKLKGLIGAFEYWGWTLPAECATVDINLQSVEGTEKLEIQMADCPSLRHLPKPNKFYCRHCDVIYRRILEPLGYDFFIDYNGLGQCHIVCSRRA